MLTNYKKTHLLPPGIHAKDSTWFQNTNLPKIGHNTEIRAVNCKGQLIARDKIQHVKQSTLHKNKVANNHYQNKTNHTTSLNHVAPKSHAKQSRPYGDS